MLQRKMTNSRERERESNCSVSPDEFLDKRVVIWALYDDAESSYKNAIEKYFHNYNLEVHSVGINDIKFKKSDKFFYHRIDLSLNNFDLIKQLKTELPHPDIILASPPCESWSGADCNGKMFRSISAIDDVMAESYNKCQWIVKNKKYYDQYNKTAHPVKRRYFIQKERGRIIGEATIGATIEIIQHFNPTVWIIENPQTSKTWQFQKEHWDFKGIENLTFYSSYDSNFSTKPTIFKSNKNLDLKKIKEKGNKNHMAKGSYSKRSSIPNELIKSIIVSCLNEIKLHHKGSKK